MTIIEAIKHLENMKWLLGVNNTAVDDIPLTKVIDGIIAILKAQGPMVMTLEEFQASGNNPKWLETKYGGHNRWTLGNAGYEKFYDNGMIGYLSIDDYGKKWRCWTSRPTEEQRERTPWN